MNNQNTAILLFSRSAKAEAKFKHLAIGRRSSEQVAGFAIETMCAIAKQTDIPLFVITEKDQRGTTFGERFANAFEDVFRKGFEKIIAVGNDCLTITTKDIAEAADLLNETNGVIGPSPDGGTYLIGLHKAGFQKQAFCDVYWQTNFTLATLQNYLVNQQCDSVLLSQKEDVDDVSDWAAILPYLSVKVRKHLLRLFSVGKNTLSVDFITSSKILFYATVKSLRAPPQSF